MTNAEGGPPPPPGGPPPGQPPSAQPPVPGAQPGGSGNLYMRKRDQQGRPLAEWWKRVVAYIIDFFVVGVPSWILMMVLGIGLGASSDLSVDPSTGELTGGGGALFGGGFIVAMLVVMALGIAYFVILNGNERGQTVGKMAMKIRVADEVTGGPIGYGRAFVRYIVAAVLWALCYIPGIIDSLFPLWDDNRQTIHDKAAKTLVVELEE